MDSPEEVVITSGLKRQWGSAIKKIESGRGGDLGTRKVMGLSKKAAMGHTRCRTNRRSFKSWEGSLEKKPMAIAQTVYYHTNR